MKSQSLDGVVSLTYTHTHYLNFAPAEKEFRTLGSDSRANWSARAHRHRESPDRKKQHVLWAHEIYINIFTTHRSLMDYSCDSNLLFIDWLASRLAAVKINKMKYGELGCDTSEKKRSYTNTHTTIQPAAAVYSNKTKSTNTHTQNRCTHGQ